MRCIIVYSFLLQAVLVCGQATLYNQGQTIFVSPGASLTVNGGYTMSESSAILDNQGFFETKNSAQPGDFIFQNNSLVQGSGIFQITGDWVNEAIFVANSTQDSKVILVGSNQEITGTQVTSFYDLELQNASTPKQMTIACRVLDSLVLNSCELASSIHKVYVDNTDPGAISFSTSYGNEGYVSSDFGGGLVRAMNSVDTFIFPVGSSIGVERFRPVFIKPITSFNDTFSVNMHNYNSIVDGYDGQQKDSTLCILNGNFYHSIEHQNANPADITVFYDPIADPDQYDRLAQWGTPVASRWNGISTSVLGTFLGNYKPVTIYSWLDYSSHAFVLGAPGPAGPDISAPNLLCAGQDSVLLIAQGSIEPYAWKFPSGYEILSSPNNDSIWVDLGLGLEAIYAVGGYQTSCPSQAGLFIPTFPFGVVADFSVDTLSVEANTLLTFQDLSLDSITNWWWSFGDQYESNMQNPQHIFQQPGVYPVILLVSDTKGCQDSVIKQVEVLSHVSYPNVFSPNADGINDFFTIPFYVQDPQFDLQIFDRWGALVFKSGSPHVAWDGTNFNGEKLSAGTYYYVFQGNSSVKKYQKTGFITLQR